MNLAVVYQNANGQIIAANPAAEMILGLSLEQMIGRTSKDPRWKALAEDGAPLEGEKHPSMMALRTGKRISDFTMGIYNPVINQTRWISVDATPLFRDGEKKPYRVYTTFKDITVLRWTIESLAASESRYRTLVNSIGDLVFVTDQDNIFREYYASEDASLYKSPEEFFNRRIDEVLPPEVSHQLMDQFELVRETGLSYVIDYPLLIEGSLRWYSARISPHMNGKSIVSVVRDITERIMAERELEQSQKELEVYASLLRHDFGNDLHILLSQIDLVESISDTRTDKAVLFESMKAILHRMANLLKVIGLPTSEDPETLGGMLSRSVKVSQTAHPESTINLDLSDEVACNKSIRGLRLLPTVLDNLLRNSIEHGGSNVTIDISLWHENDIILISVCDNGPGVSEVVKPILFQRGASTNDGGMGLYLSMNILKAYNGTIRLQDGLVQGACFIIEIPL